MNRIIELREKHDIKQIELADALSWHQSRLSNYEHGRREPSLKHSRSIVTAFRKLGVECTLDDVFPPEVIAA
jgi:putative transcriptional regulator